MWVSYVWVWARARYLVMSVAFVVLVFLCGCWINCAPQSCMNFLISNIMSSVSWQATTDLCLKLFTAYEHNCVRAAATGVGSWARARYYVMSVARTVYELLQLGLGSWARARYYVMSVAFVALVFLCGCWINCAPQSCMNFLISNIMSSESWQATTDLCLKLFTAYEHNNCVRAAATGVHKYWDWELTLSPSPNNVNERL